MGKHQTLVILLLLLLTSAAKQSAGQCAYYPVPFEQKVTNAKYIVLGKVIEKHTYIDKTGGVNTLNRLKVNAWLKNSSTLDEIFIITLGGVYGNKATIVTPSLQLNEKQEYILMLNDDNRQIDDRNFRLQHPQALQLLTYADEQGCFTNNNNFYRTIFTSPERESDFFEKISSFTGKAAQRPSGEIFQPRLPVTDQAYRINDIDGFSPTTTHGGTIVPGDFITITGSGFGATPGDVYFSNADDGGATLMSSGFSSDYTAWSDVSITVKVPSFAGTGPIAVNALPFSADELTVDYTHLELYSTFSGFATPTRQRYYFRNMNNLGGYTFTFNDGFITNAPAVAAFRRAMVTWRCNTLINWRLDPVSSSDGYAEDDVNIVMFDVTLDPGVLGRATNRFDGGAILGICELENTVLCAKEMDIQFAPDPPVAGFPWEYGTGLPSFSEIDFESVALHELGHAHGLGHLIDPGAVMHYSLTNGQSARTLAANDIAGANARMAYSTTPTCLDPDDCGSGPMVALDAGSCLTLPVSLTTFSGIKTAPSVNKLNWSTAQEQNSYGFYVQRSKDANAFEEIAFIRSAGNSSLPKNYSFPDNNAGPYPWYYRLRMADMDGKETFSQTIFLDADKNIQWKIWANENRDRIYLYGNESSGNDAVLKVFSATGQQVINRRIQPGRNEIAADNFSMGVYHYQLFYNGKIITGKLVLGNP